MTGAFQRTVPAFLLNILAILNHIIESAKVPALDGPTIFEANDALAVPVDILIMRHEHQFIKFQFQEPVPCAQFVIVRGDLQVYSVPTLNSQTLNPPIVLVVDVCEEPIQIIDDSAIGKAKDVDFRRVVHRWAVRAGGAELAVLSESLGAGLAAYVEGDGRCLVFAVRVGDWVVACLVH